MHGAVVFGISEVAVVALVIASLAAGLRLAGRYRVAGLSLAAGALAWLLAEIVHWLQLGLLVPRLEGEEHSTSRLIAGMLGDAVYFGIGGIGVLLLFFAAVVDRRPAGDGRREPVAVARQLGAAAWHYYQDRDRRERGRRVGR
ncbi:hypothetical protein DFR76_104433 [Nocardia pseudobrasiliensis]|uniref:Uncharacterized protein n=1 Tax=Nocardia pseudobrasiliensis TaxID=45979 RepID=A0A370I7I0_9NOCA|nr:hypothetical protein DFR76_104433 [Nocardia pseudobrasiliensis]